MSGDVTADEMFESLNGFDEIAIANAFGAEVTELAEKRPIGFVRALVFVDLRRKGSKDAEARSKALTMTVKEIETYFPEDEEEPMPDDPITESGKDDSQPEE